jgi:hypothetical protein
MYGFGFKFPPYRPMEGDEFSVLDLNPKFWALPTDQTTVNSLLSADFISANTEYLSSASTDFDPIASFSFGGWVNWDNIADDYTHVFGKWDDSTNNRSYTLFGRLGGLRFTMSSDGTTLTTLTPSLMPSNGTWYFIVCVYDAVNDLMKFSANGSAFETTSHSGGAYSSSTADFRIGNAIIGGINQPFDGQVDAPFFYDKALTQSDVNALYNSSTGVMYADLTTAQKTSLISWWQLNEPSGSRGDSHGTNTLTDNNTVGSAVGKIQEEVTQDGDSVYTVIDKSGTNNNALQTTITNQPTWTNAKELDFDGLTDFLNLDTLVDDVSSDTNGTFSAWVNTDSIGGKQSIINISQSNDDTYIDLYIDSLGKVNAIVRDLGDTFWHVQTDNAEITSLSWHHVSMVQDGVQPIIYVDGVAVAQSNIIDTILSWWVSDLPIIDSSTIGSLRFLSSNFNFFNGKIGEVIATSNALTSGQVSDLYNSQKSVYA